MTHSDAFIMVKKMANVKQNFTKPLIRYRYVSLVMGFVFLTLFITLLSWVHSLNVLYLAYNAYDAPFRAELLPVPTLLTWAFVFGALAGAGLAAFTLLHLTKNKLAV